jgi:hypothetical protein
MVPISFLPDIVLGVAEGGVGETGVVNPSDGEVQARLLFIPRIRHRSYLIQHERDPYTCSTT